MKAYVRAGQLEHALDRPLCMTIGCIADHLGGRAKQTFDRIARLDRERAPGEHAFERVDLLELVVAAHALLAEPPDRVRRIRRVTSGPLHGADHIGELAAWLRACSDAVVIYDLWKSISAPGD